jgi:DNA-binding GntR family transcriptional regulator
MATTALHRRTAREIIALARRENRPAGSRLSDAELAKRLGVSRTPVRAALLHLRRLGAVSHEPGRGFFLKVGADALSALAQKFAVTSDDPLYLRIASDRQAGKLQGSFSEAELRRRYGATRGTLLRTLTRAQKEGWIERRMGTGWGFTELIDSPSAYEESFQFRSVIEPFGLLLPSFKTDPIQLEALRKELQLLANGKQASTIELFESNCRFHETVAAWTGNRFVLQSLQRINSLRRLVEYRMIRKVPPRVEEHIQILDTIEKHDLIAAASMLRAHLEAARLSKIQEWTVLREGQLL